MVEFRVRETTDADRALGQEWISRLEQLRWLYKYRALSGDGKERLKSIVMDSKVYFPTYHALNDPFDSDFSFDFEATDEELDAYWSHAIPDDVENREAWIVAAKQHSSTPERMAAGERDVRDKMSRFGVFCLAAKPEDILMWSYYAEGHAGVCLRFQTEDLFWSYCTGDGLLVPVDYMDAKPRVKYFREGLISLVHSGIGSKAKAWEHEAEWRIVKPHGSGLLPFRPAALDAIIVGCRISEEDENFVRDLAANAPSPVAVLKACRKEREYGIDVEGYA